MMPRRASIPMQIGGVTVGGQAPIVVQSMTKTDTRDVAATVKQIEELAEYGCELVRVAVPDGEAAQAIGAIKRAVSTPLIADIHFDHRLALAALEAGVDGLRLNPGNIGGKEGVEAVARAARERGVPIRTGLNAGSLPRGRRKGETVAEHMVKAALEQIRILESMEFDLIKVSLKAFDVPTTIEAYKSIAPKIAYPLHLGITEAGTPRAGAIRSAIGLGILLHSGIGDTLRVSLTGHPRHEVTAAYEILRSLNLRQRGPTLISCPTCGRIEVDNFAALVTAVEERLEKMKDKKLRIAVMGCVVNGPGEAKDADVGIACGRGRGVIFRRGEAAGTVEEEDFFSALMAEIEGF